MSSWYQRNKHLSSTKLRMKMWRIKTRYQLTAEEYISLCEKQNHKCKICGEEKELHVDHCHSSGKVRGLLCHSCNNGLGCFKDNLEVVDKASSYLRESG